MNCIAPMGSTSTPQPRPVPLGLGESARAKLYQLSGMAPGLFWLPSEGKETWRHTSDLDPLRQRRRAPMFITSTWSVTNPHEPHNPFANLHLAEGFWLDIDAKAGQGQTIEDAVKALGQTVVMLQALDIPIKCCSLFASGGKGFHIFVPLALVIPRGASHCDLPTARYFPYICKAFVMQELTTNFTDTGIYNGGKGRIFRQPGVRRSNDLYKVPLAWNAWQGLNAESYRAVCSQPRNAFVVGPVIHHATGAAMAWVKAVKSVVKPRQQPAKSTSPVTDIRGNLFASERLKIERALRALAGGLDYDDWIRVGMALKSTGANDALGLWVEFSRHYPGYRLGECEAKWKTFGGSVGLGTLFHLARPARLGKNGGRS